MADGAPGGRGLDGTPEGAIEGTPIGSGPVWPAPEPWRGRKPSPRRRVRRGERASGTLADDQLAALMELAFPSVRPSRKRRSAARGRRMAASKAGEGVDAPTPERAPAARAAGDPAPATAPEAAEPESLPAGSESHEATATTDAQSQEPQPAAATEHEEPRLPETDGEATAEASTADEDPSPAAERAETDTVLTGDDATADHGIRDDEPLETEADDGPIAPHEPEERHEPDVTAEPASAIAGHEPHMDAVTGEPALNELLLEVRRHAEAMRDETRRARASVDDLRAELTGDDRSSREPLLESETPSTIGTAVLAVAVLAATWAMIAYWRTQRLETALVFAVVANLAGCGAVYVTSRRLRETRGSRRSDTRRDADC